MKVTVLKKRKRYDSRNDRSLGIQTYGEKNDYPQQVKMIVDTSGTGKSCVNVYAKFISGRGFYDKDFYKKTINLKGHTNDYLLAQISKDYALYGGFAMHVNYNAHYQIVELQHIPFEHVRFAALDDEDTFNQIAIHPDWGRQYLNLRKWKKEDIEYIHLFNPDPEQIDEQVSQSGGWKNYKGQVYYYSNEGEKVYPMPVYDSVITDMNTQEGTSNVSNRNVRNNFLTAGMLIDYMNVDDTQEQENATEKALIDFQGDEEACKIIYTQVQSKEEKPDFISFRGNNYDKEYEATRAAVKEDIGEAFNQPPILRAENVGANFGADLMQNAYNYYNSVTENERLVIERIFEELFKYWHEKTKGNYEIEPLSYEVKMTLAEKLGDKGFDQLMTILENTTLSTKQKQNMLRRLFDLSKEELKDLIPY